MRGASVWAEGVTLVGKALELVLPLLAVSAAAVPPLEVGGGVLDERHYYSSCAVQPSYPHNITITFIVIVAIIINVIDMIFIAIFIIASDGRKALLKLHNPRTATISALARRGKQRKNCPKLDSLRTIVQTQHKEVMYCDILH